MRPLRFETGDWKVARTGRQECLPYVATAASARSRCEAVYSGPQTDLMKA
jgi:hypothetical protein